MSHEGLFPKQSAADRNRGRLAFLLVLVSYAIIDFGRLQWVPLGVDTGQEWHVFYAAYAELFYHHDLAHWFPYGIYGQPNILYNLMESSCSDYLMMAIGKVFHIKNAVLLFQLSLMADHLLFLFGIHLLARSLFQRQSTVWLCLIGSMTLLNGLHLPSLQLFRMVSWYPLILYFLARFFREQRPAGLWLAGTLFSFSCLGNAHFHPHVALAMVPFAVVGTWKHPGAWRAVFRYRTGNLPTMILFVASASLYLCLASHVMDGISTVRPGRAASGVAAVDDFLGGPARLLFSMVVSFFAGHCFYIGLLPFGCVLWGLFRARTPTFAVFMITALFMAWFSMGGLLAFGLYYSVPFISLMHHLFMGFFMVTVLLLLAAGAAWDVFTSSRKDLKLWLALPVMILFAIDFCLYADYFPLGTKNLHLFLSSIRWALIKLAVYAGLLLLAAVLSLALRSVRPRFGHRWQASLSFRALAAAALLTGLFIDVFQYSYRSGTSANVTIDTYRDDPPTPTWEPVKKTSPVYQACYVRPLTWQEKRLDRPDDERKKVVLETPAYVNTYAFAQFDPCRPEFPQRAIGTAMHKLLALRDQDDPALRVVLGCHAPKLRLLTRAIYVRSEAEAQEAVRTQGDLVNVAILQWSTGSPDLPTTPAASTETPGSVSVTDFGANAIEMRVHVTAPAGAWLVYADTYDPRWRAWVNSKPAPIVPAYVGLKAVLVPHGKSVVRLKFSAWSNVGVRVLAIGGALCSLCLLLYCGICCVRGFPPSKRKVSDPSPPFRDKTG